MSVATYFDVQSSTYQAGAGEAAASLVSAPAEKRTRDEKQRVIVALDSVMYTGRVPISTWLFAIEIGHKLWISNRTTMYFGKQVNIRRPIYSDMLHIDSHRIELDMGISAYNSYGDLLKTRQSLRFYESRDNMKPGNLIQMEQDWMHLMFKFRINIQPALQT